MKLLILLLALVPGVVAPPPAVGSGLGPPAVVDFAAPLAGRLIVTRSFDPPATAYGPGHRGVDLAGPPGVAVLAAGGGTVSFAGQAAGVLVVAVTHDDGIRTTYEPMASLRVHVGAKVSAGTELGTLANGHPGCTAPAGLTCLHWGALRGASYLNPLLLLGTQVVLLTPVAS